MKRLTPLKRPLTARQAQLAARLHATTVEIGTALGVHPSRISQLTTAELRQARAIFNQEAR